MRGKSHHCLGKYLLECYMPDISPTYARSFLLGCIQPDKNPVTYLKGSIKYQWLRGHNYHNARRYMQRMHNRLERKKHWNIFDYYTFGKLIHYTADAFTYAHNHIFTEKLEAHRQYESQLQIYFIKHLQQDPIVDIRIAKSIIEILEDYHKEYITAPADIHTDSKFILNACCCVAALLIPKRIL